VRHRPDSLAARECRRSSFVERRAGRTREHRFELTFRTLTVQQMSRELARTGFRTTAVLGDYHGRTWDDRADVWIILAEKG
jgi:hypothetical protein